MAYTTRQLIIDAYYLSGIVSRDLETVTGAQINDGLDRLNDFLQIKGADTKLIEYFTVVNDFFVAGQEIYFFPNLIEIDTFTFFLQNPVEPNDAAIRFQMREMTREEYFAPPRAEHIQTLPYTWHLERVYGGCEVRVYFIPDKPYAYQIVGKFALQSTTLNQDLSLIYDGWYLTYLKYGLCIWLSEWRSVKPAMSVVETFKNMEQKMSTLSPIDFTHRKINYFKSSGALNWADVNYGHGWRSNG